MDMDIGQACTEILLFKSNLNPDPTFFFDVVPEPDSTLRVTHVEKYIGFWFGFYNSQKCLALSFFQPIFWTLYLNVLGEKIYSWAILRGNICKRLACIRIPKNNADPTRSGHTALLLCVKSADPCPIFVIKPLCAPILQHCCSAWVQQNIISKDTPFKLSFLCVALSALPQTFLSHSLAKIFFAYSADVWLRLPYVISTFNY